MTQLVQFTDNHSTQPSHENHKCKSSNLIYWYYRTPQKKTMNLNKTKTKRALPNKIAPLKPDFFLCIIKPFCCIMGHIVARRGRLNGGLVSLGKDVHTITIMMQT
jgi:hypothetical protein